MKDTKEFDKYLIKFVNDVIISLDRHEVANGGPRAYWFMKGVKTTTSIVAFFAVPKYRLLTGTYATLQVLDSLVTLGAVKSFEDDIKKRVSEMFKKQDSGLRVEEIIKTTADKVKKEDLN